MQRVIFLACLVALAIATPATEPEIPGLPNFKPVSELPSNIPTCSQKDSNINECLRSAFQQLTPRLKEGFPELNIPPMDPFILDRSHFEFNSGLAQGRVHVKNVRVFGMSDAEVKRVNFVLKDGRVNAETVTHLPRLYIEGNYKADVKFNDVKMTPKGYFNVTMSDITMKTKPEGELYEHDGHSYLRVTKFDFEPQIGDMHVYASGLFPDESLNSVILDFVNQYWRQIAQTMLPETRSTWEPLLLRSMNAFLAAVPFDLFITKN